MLLILFILENSLKTQLNTLICRYIYYFNMKTFRMFILVLLAKVNVKSINDKNIPQYEE